MLLQGKRIIYIEDDMRNRTLVDLVLSSEGAKVWFERWGVPATALTTVTGHLPVDLILLDLMFPNGYSGYDIFQELRKHSILKNVPIVLISAADPSVEMRKARQLGFDSFIPKPIDAETFPEQLLSIMEGNNIWQAAAE